MLPFCPAAGPFPSWARPPRREPPLPSFGVAHRPAPPAALGVAPVRFRGLRLVSPARSLVPVLCAVLRAPALAFPPRSLVFFIRLGPFNNKNSHSLASSPSPVVPWWRFRPFPLPPFFSQSASPPPLHSAFSPPLFPSPQHNIDDFSGGDRLFPSKSHLSAIDDITKRRPSESENRPVSRTAVGSRLPTSLGLLFDVSVRRRRCERRWRCASEVIRREKRPWSRYSAPRVPPTPAAPRIQTPEKKTPSSNDVGCLLASHALFFTYCGSRLPLSELVHAATLFATPMIAHCP